MVEESEYKADLELLDRYVGFSSEVVRISLLGLAAIGFYLKEFAGPSAKPLPTGIVAGWFFMLLGFAAFLLAVAVGCGLLHRYYATDGLARHIKVIRDVSRAEEEARTRVDRYRLSGRWLVSCECAAASGVAILGVAFGVRFGVFGDVPRWTIAIPVAAICVLAAATVAVLRWISYFHKSVASSSTERTALGPER